MAYDSGKYTYTLTSSGLKEAQGQAQSINKNMTEAALASSRMGKAASGALNSTSKGTFGESVAYGQARGTTGQTGASARDFANQAQGLGGLVRLYATFAANIFAVGMAFEALKRSFQFEQLQTASNIFAVSIGKDLSGVAKQLATLSQGTLTDKAAQQMANYGSSAGFTTEQMKRIIVVARGASQALGRDMGDAIDRLMRGAGKLNPELLDELGLLTRVKPAYAEYARQVGKTADSLTGFEKTQAFTNAILKEGEEKFGAIGKAIQSSPFERFTASLLSMGTTVGNVVNKGLVPLLDFFANNPSAMIAGMALAFGKLLMTALPALSSLGQGSKAAAEAQAASLKAMKSRVEEAAKSTLQVQNDARKANIAAIERDSHQQLEELNSLKKANMEAASAIAVKSKSIQELAKTGILSNATINKAVGQMDPKIHAESINVLDQAKQRNLDIDQIKNHIITNAGKQAAIEEQINAATEKGLVTQGWMNKLLEKRAMISSQRATGLANVEEIARVGQLGNAFSQLGKVAEGTRSTFVALNGTGTLWKTIGTEIAVANTWISGSFRIATAAAATFLSTIGIWIGVITLAVAGIAAIMSVTGGFSKKLDEATSAQEDFATALGLTGQQTVKFQDLQSSVIGTADSFLKLSTYSSNVFTAMTEGLDKTAAAFSAYANDTSGYFDRFLQWGKNLVGMQTVVSKQMEQVRTVMFTVLSNVSPEDKAKVEQAIISALPSASSVSDVFSKLGDLTGGQLATFGEKLSSNLKVVNEQIKSSAENLKVATGAWTSLGEAVDKYNEKQTVKDPKLKDIVKDLEAVNNAYSAAKSDKERSLVLSGLDKELQDKLVKLAEDRGVAIQAWVEAIDKARAASAQYAEEERLAAEKKKAQQKTEALSFVPDLEGFNKQLKEYETVQNRLKTGAYSFDMGTGKDANAQREEDLARLKRLKSSIDDSLVSGSEAAKKVGNMVASETALGTKRGFDTAADNFIKSMENKIDELRGKIPRWIQRMFGAEEAGQAIQSIIGSEPKFLTQEETDRESKNLRQKGLSQLEKDNNKQAFEQGVALAKSLAALKAQKDHHDHIAKSFELELKLAAAQEAAVKRVSDIEKETIGFISEQTASKVEEASVNRAQVEYTKQLETLRIEYENAAKDGRKGAEESYVKGKAAATDTLKVAQEMAALEKLRSAQLRDRVQLEKLYIEPLREALSIQQQITDAQRTAGLISEKNAEFAKSESALALANLDIIKRQSALDAKRLENRAAPVDRQVSDVIFNAEQKLIDLTKQRLVITKQLSDELSAQKQIWDQMAVINDAISRSLEIQLNYFTQLVDYATALRMAGLSEKITAAEITKSYLDRAKAAGIELESEDGLLLKQAAILELTDRIYQQRVKMYELASKDGSGANALKTIGQGFAIEAEKFKKAMKSTVQTIVSGTLDAIDAPINHIVQTITGKGKLTGKELAQSITDSLTATITNYAADQMKKWARDALAGLFDTKEMDLKEIQQKAAEAIRENTGRIDNLNARTVELTDKLGQVIASLTNLIASNKALASNAKDASDPTTGKYDQDMWPGITESVKDSSSSLDDFAVTVGYGSQAYQDSTKAVTTNAGWFDSLTGSFAGGISTMKQFFGVMAGALPKGAGQTINTALGVLDTGTKVFNGVSNMISMGYSLFGSAAAGWAGSVAAGGATGLMTTAVGAGASPLATSLLGGSGALYGAAPAAATFGGGGTAALFGATTAGEVGTLGAVAAGEVVGGATLATSLAPLIAAAPYIAVAVVAIYALSKYLNSKKGGPKLESYASTDNTLEGEAALRNQSRTRESEAGNANQLIVNGLKTSYMGLVAKYGGKAGVGDFAMRTSIDTAGTASPFLDMNAYVGGKNVYSSHFGDNQLSRDAEEFSKQVTLETSRALFASIRASDLPKNLADYFNSVTEEGIHQLSQEDLTKKFDFANVLSIINSNIQLITATFGEDLTTLTESTLAGFQQEGETYVQTFERLNTEFSITSQLAKILGVNITDAFGEIGLAGTQAREQLIGVAGGLDNLVNKTTYFFEHFYSEAERNSIALSNAVATMNSGFAALGKAVPESRTQFRQMVSDALAAGDYSALNSLLDLAPAVDAFFTSIEDGAKRLLDFADVLTVINSDTQLIIETFGVDLTTLTESTLAGFQHAGELIGQTFGRLNSEFSITSQLAKLLGVSITDAFGEIGLAGTQAREQLIELAGGLDKFTTKTTFFIEHFYSKAERDSIALSNAVTTMGSGFAALGKEIPKSRAQFRQMVSAALADGNYAMLNSLLDLSPAVDKFFTSIEDGNKIIEDGNKAILEANKAISSVYDKNIELTTSANELNAAFGELGIAVPQSAEDFVKLYNTIDLNTASGKKLYSVMVSIAPAFATVNGAIEKFKANIASIAKSLGSSYTDFMDTVLQSIQSPLENYSMYASRADVGAQQLRDINAMSPEELIANKITPEMVQSLADKVLKDATTAYGFLTPEQQKGGAGQQMLDFIGTTNGLVQQILSPTGSLATVITDSIRNGTSLGPVTTPSITAENLVLPNGTSLSTDTVPTDTTADTTGATQTDFGLAARTFSDELLNSDFTRRFLDSTGQLGQDNLDKQALFNGLYDNMNRTVNDDANSRNTFAANLSRIATAMLDASNNMLIAANGQQSAAATPQRVMVDVNLAGGSVRAPSNEVGARR